MDSYSPQGEGEPPFYAGEFREEEFSETQRLRRHKKGKDLAFNPFSV